MGLTLALTSALTYFVGLAYPAYVTVQALETPGTQDDHLWLTYWLIFSIIQLTEGLLWPVLQWLGSVYYIFKTGLLAWLVLPQTKGASFVYEALLSPGLKKASLEAHKIPAIKKVLDAVDNFTAGKPVTKGAGKIE